MSNCVICTQPLEQKSTGRPRQYYSTSCRKMSEREVKRVEKRITYLEDKIMDLRVLEPRTAMVDGRVEDCLIRYETELQSQNTRFKILLETSPDNI